MDVDEKDSTEEPSNEAAKAGNVGKNVGRGSNNEMVAGRLVDPSGSVDHPHQNPERDRLDDDDGDKIAKEDLENAIIKMSAKTIKQWRDYEKSLERPRQDSATEDPLRRSMEDLKLRGKNSPGATSSSSLNVSRTSRSNTKKKGKRPSTKKNDGRGSNNELVAGRLVDPSGSVDHPHQNPERDEETETQDEPDQNMKKFFACRYCDETYEFHSEWKSVLQDHKDVYHGIKDAPLTTEDYTIFHEYVQESDDEDGSAVVIDLEPKEEELYISCNWCSNIYKNWKRFAKHATRVHDKPRFNNSDYKTYRKKKSEEVPIEEAMEVEVITSEDPIEDVTIREGILDLSAEERREAIERYEEERHRRVESPKFKRKVSSHVFVQKKYLDKNGNSQSQREAILDSMHSAGDTARKGSAESRERTKNLKMNPRKIREQPLDHCIRDKSGTSYDAEWPSLASTTTRTHPTKLRNMLKRSPMKGELAKEVKEAIQRKRDLEIQLDQNREQEKRINAAFERLGEAMAPREPVEITIATAKMNKKGDARDDGQNERGATSTTPSTSRSLTTSNMQRSAPNPPASASTSTLTPRNSNIGRTNFEIVSVPTGLPPYPESPERDRENHSFQTAPSTPGKRGSTAVSSSRSTTTSSETKKSGTPTEARLSNEELRALMDNDQSERCPYCGLSFSNAEVLKMHLKWTNGCKKNESAQEAVEDEEQLKRAAIKSMLERKSKRIPVLKGQRGEKEKVTSNNPSATATRGAASSSNLSHTSTRLNRTIGTNRTSTATRSESEATPARTTPNQSSPSPQRQFGNFMEYMQSAVVPLTPVKNRTAETSGHAGGLPSRGTGQELARECVRTGGAMNKKEESQLLHHVMEISRKDTKTNSAKVTDVITLEDTEDSDESDTNRRGGARNHGLAFEQPWEEASRTAGTSGTSGMSSKIKNKPANKPKYKPGPASKTRAAPSTPTSFSPANRKATPKRKSESNSEDLNSGGNKQRKSNSKPESRASAGKSRAVGSSEPVGPASTNRTVKNPLYKPAPKEKSLPDTPKVKRLVNIDDVCDNKNAEYDGPRCLNIRCCRHRMLSTKRLTSQERASAHERECQAGGHRHKAKPALERSSESERGSESGPEDIEVISESEMDTEDEVSNVDAMYSYDIEPTDSENEWQREVNETEANQNSMSSYEHEHDHEHEHEHEHDDAANYMDQVQEEAATSEPSSPIKVRGWEVEYDSEDEVNWGDLYKKHHGDEKSWPFPEDSRQVIRTGTKPKIRRKVTLIREGTNANTEAGNEEPEERIGDERDKYMQNEILKKANNLTERQFKNLMRDLDYEKMADVIEGPPFHTIESKQTIRQSKRYINDPNEHPPNHPYKAIRYDRIIEKRLRVRPINRTGLELAKSGIEEMRRFSRGDRARYKMVIIQMLENLDFLCAPYQYRKIDSGNPIKTVKKYIDDFYH